MGPTIIFDKSALQSLGGKTLPEVNRYFQTVVPPVLLYEILGDLSLNRDDLGGSQTLVAQLANKLFPADCFVTTDLRTLCVQDLLGNRIPQDHVPVAPATRVRAADGSKGAFIDIQPEDDALLRWRRGHFYLADLDFATRWRKHTTSANIQSLQRNIAQLPRKLSTVQDVAEVVDGILADSEMQETQLEFILSLLRCNEGLQRTVWRRWNGSIRWHLKAFSPYAFHCLRVHLCFLFALKAGLVGTKATNFVDLEYFCYLPFAQVFCSGDKFHRALAPILIESDQSFVWCADLRQDLIAVADARTIDPDHLPSEQSAVCQLWQRHLGSPPRLSRQPVMDQDSVDRLMGEIAPILESLKSAAGSAKERPRFPV